MSNTEGIVSVGGTPYSTWLLANMAECSVPDNLDSPGADFLRSIANDVDDLIIRYREDKTPESRYNDNGECSEIADAAPDVYTHEMWREFVDLCAYREDPTELDGPIEDMDKAARVCLYIIAERLVNALLQDAGPFDEEDDNEEG